MKTAAHENTLTSKGEPMDWEEIILSALRNNEDIEITLKRAAQVAPKEIILAFEDFPDDISEIRKNLSRYPKVVSLLFLHVLAAMGELFYTFPIKEQKNTLESAVDASLEASLIARDLGEKRLEASYLGIAANALYRLRRFSRAEKVYREAVEKFRVLSQENSVKLKEMNVLIYAVPFGLMASNRCLKENLNRWTNNQVYTPLRRRDSLAFTGHILHAAVLECILRREVCWCISSGMTPYETEAHILGMLSSFLMMQNILHCLLVGSLNVYL